MDTENASSLDAANLAQVFLREGPLLQRLYVREIVSIQDVGAKRVLLLRTNAEYHLTLSLTALRQVLPAERFIQVHPEWIIHLEYVAQIEPVTNSLRLTTGIIVPLADEYRGDLLKQLRILE